MLPAVLDALTEIAFEPEFLPSRIEKERKAVVAEAQMMNTIEYRVDCQLLQYLHWENALGCRFPIGKTDQVQQWQRAEIMNFWSRNYFPKNATLYVVGDVDVAATKELIAETFGRVPASMEEPQPGAVELNAELIASTSSNGNFKSNNTNDGSNAAGEATGALLDQISAGASLIRPPVEHQWGCGRMLHSGKPAPVSIFRHRLLQTFQLSVFCKVPVRPMSTMQDLRRAFMVRILLSVMQFRINARYVAADPPFVAIELDHSDSGREGCAVSTLTVTSEPKDWRGAVRVAVQEVRRLQRFGVTTAELERYKSALLRDSEQLAEGAESVPSLDNLEFVMESLALGHTVLEQREAHACLMALADTITPGEVNGLARSLLSYVSHYRNESALVKEYEEDPEGWAVPGPTAATSIVACVPAFMDASGHSTGSAAPMQRGASMATTQHVDPASVSTIEDSGEDDEPPEGAVRFELDAAAIEDALSEVGLEVEALPDVDVPDALISPEDSEVLLQERKPQFVPLDGPNGTGDVSPPADPTTGVVRRRLSNGITVNYCKTDNEPCGAMVRVVAAGGRALENSGVVGPSGHGVVAVGTRTLSESGTVGAWSREQVELFCISRLINCVLEANEEFTCMDFHFAVGDGGVAAVMQLLHLFLEKPRWEDAAMERSKQMYLSHYRSLPKSLERATADRIMAAMMGSDRRFRDPSTEEIESLTLEGMRVAVMEQLHAGNLEVSVVGDIELEELEEAVLMYLGTVQAKSGEENLATAGQPAMICSPAPEERHMVWHLKDSDERACAYIAGPAPNRWGNFSSSSAAASSEAITANGNGVSGKEVIAPLILGPDASPMQLTEAALIRRAHPLYASVTLGLLTEIINSRLFTTVRDTLGLTYDVSFELALFDRLPTGWFHVNVTSTPEKIKDAMMASLRVLRSGASQAFTHRDLLRAKRTLLTRHESDLKDNTYWLALLTHLQSEAVPLKSVECLRDLRAMYETITVDDIYDAYSQFDFSDDAVFTCIGTSGKEAVLNKSPVLEQGPGGGNGGGATPPEVDPEAFMNALKAFMGNMQQQPGGGKQ
jgi:predicted Zn-dependent peptidase